MPEIEKNEFKFPDENAVTFEKTEAPEIELEIEDDTPPEDRGRQPLPEPLKEELEKDDLEAYDDEVKTKLKQMRKVWHDERREKEAADRERQEALRVAQALMHENQRIKTILDTGGKEYASTLQKAASLELEMARRAYKEAYDSGDSDAIMAAQEKLTDAGLRVRQAENFRMPPLQQEEYVVQNAPSTQEAPRPVNPKLAAWQERNSWYGKDDEMTASALGLHEKLKKSGEVQIGSDEYYAILDKTIRKRFPEYFEDTEVQKAKTETRTKPSTVVAPAVRSTAPQRIRLKQSQVNLAKKLGLTPQQYALELSKLEAQNG
jgi:hypothetical protein